MLRRFAWVAVAVAALLLAACESGRHASAGFRLAAGDAARGKQAFLDMECYTCHEVAGSDLPRPSVQPPVPVKLGGAVLREKTDGYLAAAILNPSHAIAGHPKELVTIGNRSRMPDLRDRMTLQQLTDLVEFLQQSYTLRTAESNRFGY